MNIKIGNQEYEVTEAKTASERRKGLQGIENLPDDQGMLFYFDTPRKVSMYMKGVDIPLDIIFIDEDQVVTKVAQGEPQSTKLITENNVAYVLEVNINSGISEGDELELNADQEPPVMKVLAQDGSNQMELWGGERIFRRAFTKQLINLIKQADSVKDDSKKYESLCKRIGKKMFKEINAQDNRPPEYVNTPN